MAGAEDRLERGERESGDARLMRIWGRLSEQQKGQALEALEQLTLPEGTSAPACRQPHASAHRPGGPL